MQEPQNLTLQTQDMPLDILVLIASYLEINKLLIPMLVKKTWHRATLPRWRELLVRDFDVDPNIAKLLPHPNVVYRKISQAIPDKYGKHSNFVGKYGLSSFCVCLDVEDKQQLAIFFQNNPVPDLSEVAFLGNLALVKYLIEECNRSFALATKSAKISGSIPLLLYFIDEWGLSDTSYSSHYKDTPPSDLGQLFRHWNKVSPFMSYKSLALTGSIEMVKKMNVKQDPYPDLDVVLGNAVSSGSLALVKYLYEDPFFRLRQQFDDYLKNGAIDQSFILARASRLGTLSTVRYLIESRKIKPSHTTMLSAVESGSLAIAKYVRENIQSTPSEQPILQDNIYPWVAVSSGSLRMVKDQWRECKRHNSLKNDLDHAAELGLLAILIFILAQNPPAPDHSTQLNIMHSKFATLNFLTKFPTIQIGQQDLLYIGRFTNLFFLRQIVEEKKLVPTEETKQEISKTLNMRTKIHTYDNARYLMGVTQKNNSTTFWNRVLSSPCKNTVDRLTCEILFDNKGKPQEWHSSSLAIFRMIRGRSYANTFSNPCNYLVITDKPERKHNVISIEITWVMAEILNITKDLPELTLKKSFLQTEQVYLKALREIHIKLEQGMSLKLEPSTALVLYQRWHRIIGQVIANNQEIETGVDPKCSLSAT